MVLYYHFEFLQCEATRVIDVDTRQKWGEKPSSLPIEYVCTLVIILQ